MDPAVPAQAEAQGGQTGGEKRSWEPWKGLRPRTGKEKGKPQVKPKAKAKAKEEKEEQEEGGVEELQPPKKKLQQEVSALKIECLREAMCCYEVGL